MPQPVSSPHGSPIHSVQSPDLPTGVGAAAGPSGRVFTAGIDSALAGLPPRPEGGPAATPGGSGAAGSGRSGALAPRVPTSFLGKRGRPPDDSGSGVARSGQEGCGTRRTSPLQQHEVNEAGYLTARAAQGRPIERPDDVRRLVDGNEAVNNVRTRLYHGRGNVDADLRASKGRSGQLVNATYEIAKSNESLAAAAYGLHVGNCDHHARIVVRLHSPKLAEGETAVRLTNTELQHSWGEIRAPERPGVTLDPWANGPAMQSVDTVWQERHNSALTGDMETFDAKSGKTAKKAMIQQARTFASAAGKREDKQVLKKQRPVLPGTDGTYAESTPLAGSFAKDARASLQAHSPVIQEVMAVHAARTAYQMNIATAGYQAQAILGAARTLDTMPDSLARPPLGKQSTR